MSNDWNIFFVGTSESDLGVSLGFFFPLKGVLAVRLIKIAFVAR